jgi:REP element-mobilizing transposase RayT
MLNHTSILKWFRGFMILLLMALFISPGPALARPGQLQSPTPMIDAAVIDALNGAGARVIIQLSDPIPAGANVEEHLPEISAAQASVLGSLPVEDFQIIHQYANVPALAGILTANGLEILKNDARVSSIILDQPGSGHLGVSVPALQANIVHSMGYTGQGITVAVLDTGVDTDHPDLSDDIVAQHCFTAADCPFGNTNEGTSAEDENGHGTNVTGIITSKGTISSVGFAPDANIVAVRVLDSSSGGWVSDWVAGLDWVRTNQGTLGVDVINMSLGTNALYSGNCDVNQPTVHTVVSQLNALGIVIFASTGNQGSSTQIASPACNTGVVAVGATYDSNLGREPDAGTYNSLFGGSWPACFDGATSLQTITCFTNSNAMMDIVAPGAPITSTGLGGGTSMYRGTSQASPTAAGIAALMLQANPALTPAQIETNLKNTGTPIMDPRNSLSFPLINALAAVNKPPLAFSKSNPSNGAAGQPTSLTLSWAASTGATSYEYCLDATVNSSCNAGWTSNGASTSKALTGLTPDASYEWHVRAVNPGGTTYSNGSSTAFWTFSTLPVSIDDNYEQNDTLATAYDLSNLELTWLSAIDGYGLQADEDWYRIYVTPGYERILVDARFTHSQGDIDIALYNAAGTRLALSQGIVDNEYIDYLVPGGGTYYYIRVYYGNQGNQYDLWWDDVLPRFGLVSKWTSAFDLSHGWTVADFVRTVGDVNNDGRDDLVGFGQNGVWVSLSTGSGFPTPTRWVQAFDLAHGWTVQDYVRTVGDVNGDGKTDLVGFGQNGVWVSLSTGSSFPAPTRWVQAFDLAHGWTVQDYVRTVGDVNGDGKADLVGFGQNGVWVSLSTGSSFPAPSKWTSAFDLSHGWTVAQFVRTVGDVNGDGMADLVGFGLDGVWVSLSTGSGFNAVSKWTGAFALANGWTVAQYVRMVGDVNGDGKADIVGFGQDGVYIGLSTGSTFSLGSRRTTSFDLSHGWTVADFVRTVGDVSGDGKSDLVGFGQNGVYISLAQ